MIFESPSYIVQATSLLGWDWFTQGVNAMVENGIIYFVFLTLLYKNWYKLSSEDSNNNTTILSIKRMLFDTMVIGVMYVLLFIPFFEISSSSYIVKDGNNQSKTVNQSEDQYSKNIKNLYSSDIDTLKIPIWFAGLEVFSGFFNSIFLAIPKKSSLNFRKAITQLNAEINIKDPSVINQYNHFYSECYTPTYSKFSKKWVGNDDTSWVGSKFFLKTPGLYKRCSQTSCQYGIYPTGVTPITKPIGWLQEEEYPTCQEWWSGIHIKFSSGGQDVPDHPNLNNVNSGYVITFDDNEKTDVNYIKSGLENKLYQEAKNSVNTLALANQRIKSIASTRYKSEIIKLMIKKQKDAGSGSSVFNGNPLDWIKNIATNITTSVALGVAWIITSFVSMFVVIGLPIVQALTLLIIILFMPLYIIISNFSLAGTLRLSFLYLTVKFWSVLWFFIEWFDNYLYSTLYGDAGYAGSTVDFLWNATLGDSDNTGIRITFNIIILLMYLSITGLFTKLMDDAGLEISKEVGGDLSDARDGLKSGGKTITGVTNKLKIKK